MAAVVEDCEPCLSAVSSKKRPSASLAETCKPDQKRKSGPTSCASIEPPKKVVRLFDFNDRFVSLASSEIHSPSPRCSWKVGASFLLFTY